MKLSPQDVFEAVKTIGLVCAGFWTAWTFHKLQKVRAAESEIEASRLTQQETRTRLAGQQPQLDIELKVVDTVLPGEMPQDCLSITVVLKNLGTQNFFIQFSESTLVVGRIVLAKNNQQSIKELHRSGPLLVPEDGKPELFPDRIFRVGQRRQLGFVVPITGPGVYFIQFHAIYSRFRFDDEKESRKKPTPIVAVEQMIHITGSKSSES